MDTFSILESSETGIVRGDFVILFKHGHWHLIGTRRKSDERYIVSVHVMSPGRARSTLAETPSAKPKSYAELGLNFAAEVSAKVLPSAEEYAPLFKAGIAGLSAGFHTDTMQQFEYSSETGTELLQAVSGMMRFGEPGICVYFKHAL